MIQLHVRDVLALSIEQVELQADVVSYGAVSGRIRDDEASKGRRGFSCYEGPSGRMWILLATGFIEDSDKFDILGSQCIYVYSILYIRTYVQIFE